MGVSFVGRARSVVAAPEGDTGEDDDRDGGRDDAGVRLAVRGGGPATELRGLGPGARLDVQACLELGHGRGELLALARDVGLDLFRAGAVDAGFLATHASPPFRTETSSRTLEMVRSGVGGAAACTSLRPARAAPPAPANRTTVMISAAAQAGRTSASARIAVVISVAIPKNASRPAALNIPMPSPALLPF